MTRKFPKSLTDAILLIKKQEIDYCTLHNDSIAQVGELKKQLTTQIEETNRIRNLRSETEQAEKRAIAARDETRKQFDDLKQRLRDSELELARLQGYLARVHEDDTVREELITAGEPGGQENLVPKRKHASLANYNFDATRLDNSHSFESLTYGEERRRPKHWVNY